MFRTVAFAAAALISCSIALAEFRFSIQSLTPDLERGRALAINDNGAVVGRYGQEEASQSFLWTPASGLELLPPLPQSPITAVYDINNPGVIALILLPMVTC